MVTQVRAWNGLSPAVRGYRVLGLLAASLLAVYPLVVSPAALADPKPAQRNTGMAQPTCDPSVASPCYQNSDNAYAGGGGLVSTIADMATFVAANLGFNKAPDVWPALQMTHRGQGIGPDCATCSGLGWVITPPNARDSVSKFAMLAQDGGTWGMHSHTYLFPDACWGITFLSNSDQAFPLSTKVGFAGPIISTWGPRKGSQQSGPQS
jgi:CubicO group peptidase (beta-lactamase class C family)